jgi:hypothetical protein
VDKVGVCHRTASESNPYVLINVPQDEANGHITGTSKQHNHKVYWNEAGVYDGITHAAGDERMDYYASDGLSGNCSNGQPPTEGEDASATVNITDATCESGATASQGETVHAYWDPESDTVTGPDSYSFTATAGEGFTFEGGEPSQTFSGDLAGPLTGQQCAEQPEPTTRTVDYSEQSCDLGGVHTWDVLFTTTYSWDEATGKYVGTEDAGVTENDNLAPYTQSEFETLGCVEVLGEQGHSHHGGNNHQPEVKGEQATVAPAAAAVPAEVEAGLAGAPAGTPNGGGSSLPLWALLVGAGLFLTGASRMRRTGRIPR